MPNKQTKPISLDSLDANILVLPEHTPEKLFEYRELQVIINEALDTLTEPQKEVIRLLFYNRLSMADVARLKGISRQSVSRCRNLAFKKLARKLEGLKDNFT